MDILNEQLQYFNLKEKEFNEKYLNKFVVIHNKKMIGAYDNDADAYSFASKNFEAGTFLIRQCLKDRKPQVFYSRVY